MQQMPIPGITNDIPILDLGKPKRMAAGPNFTISPRIK